MVVDILFTKGSIILAVKAVIALASGDQHVSFIEFEAHRACDLLLSDLHKGIQRVPQAGIPLSVIDQLGVLKCNLIFILQTIFI